MPNDPEEPPIDEDETYTVDNITIKWQKTLDKNVILKVAFASEIKAILQLPEFKRKINENALQSYFTHRYFPGEDTIFQGFFKK